jgi:Tfp pilus assembly protein PilX
MPSPTPSVRARDARPRSERGAVLIVALLLSAIIAIALGSYLALSRNSLQLANRSFYNTAAMNIAETGVEEALWSFNQVATGSSVADAWTGWDTSDTVTAKRAFRDFTLSGTTEAYVKVYVTNYNPTGNDRPLVVSSATVTIPGESRTITKAIETTLRRRSKFAMGLVAKNQLTFNGTNASVDSWNSDPDNDLGASTPAIPYSVGVRKDNGSVGSTSVAVGSVAVNNADIWGFASVGSSGSSGISVGTNGTVAAFMTGGSPTPTGTVDTTRIATDFTANFDPVNDPTIGTVIGAVGASLGTAGTTTTFRFNGQINSSLAIAGNVTLILTAGAGNTAIRLTGAGDGISIPAGSSLTVYTAADVTIAGNGLLNSNIQPTTFQLWGTSTSSFAQNIEIKGNGALKGIAYAPNANVRITGNGDVMGSIVANNITVVGNAAFHYDESLANWGGSNPFGVVNWRELTTAADRAVYVTQINAIPL